MGAMFAVVFSGFGAAIGTSKIGSWILSSPSSQESKEIQMQPLLEQTKQQDSARSLLKYFVGVILSGVVAIYGLIIAVMVISSTKSSKDLDGVKHLAAGLSVGLCCLAAGWSIGNTTGSARVDAQFTPLVVLWIYGEAIALYGFIVALLALNAY